MNKLYYIVCEEKETTLFEGRYQGRTRGGALKFLKQSLGRKTLNGLVFTITEIPVPLIREIVAEILAGGDTGIPASNVVPLTRSEPAPEVGDPAPAADAAQAKVTPSKAGRKATVNPVLCKGCGLCNAKCPTMAIQLKHFTDEEIFSQIDAVVPEEEIRQLYAAAGA
jgi:NAD-dependent dihydropyrimidine dehydrogenase PreA subunit